MQLVTTLFQEFLCLVHSALLFFLFDKIFVKNDCLQHTQGQESNSVKMLLPCYTLEARIQKNVVNGEFF